MKNKMKFSVDFNKLCILTNFKTIKGEFLRKKIQNGKEGNVSENFYCFILNASLTKWVTGQESNCSKKIDSLVVDYYTQKLSKRALFETFVRKLPVCPVAVHFDSMCILVVDTARNQSKVE